MATRILCRISICRGQNTIGRSVLYNKTIAFVFFLQLKPEPAKEGFLIDNILVLCKTEKDKG